MRSQKQSLGSDSPSQHALRLLRQWRQVLSNCRTYRRATHIIVGAGGTAYPGWLSTEQDGLDVTSWLQFRAYWRRNTLYAILAEHVWEHLDSAERARANHNCCSFLKPGGTLRIAVPDGLHPNSEYIDSVRPGGTGAGAEDHRVLFTYRTLTEELMEGGFKVSILEYWDEAGEFHIHRRSDTMGIVQRSYARDRRNADGHPNYTSLIVDAIKPEVPAVSTRAGVGPDMGQNSTGVVARVPRSNS